MKKYLNITVMLLALVALAVQPVLAAQETCPQDSGWIKTDIDTEDATWSYTAPEGLLIAESCVKAGSDKSTDGQALNFTVYDPAVPAVTLESATGKGISHYSVRLVEPTPEPSPSPTPEPTPSPTPEPSPSVTPTPEPTPTDSPSPSVTPTPEESEIPVVIEEQELETPESLPVTGSREAGIIGLSAMLLLGAGYGLLRRFRPTVD